MSVLRVFSRPFPRVLSSAPPLVAALVLSWGCGRESTPPRRIDAEAALASHSRMISFLDQIRQRTADENPFLGDLRARGLREQLARLPADTDDATRLRLLYEVGNAELRLGRIRESIDYLSQAHDLLSRTPDPVPREHANLVRFQLGLAYLRLGVTENCWVYQPSEACVIPIRPGGVHMAREGSTAAIPHLLDTLAGAEPGNALHLCTRWLLNIAHMTLGTWPDGVPREHLVPPSAFAADVEFPLFINIAHEIGLNTFNLAGGVCIDDFDGDEYLDVVTSTWDTAGQLRFFRNDRNGTFSDRTAEAGLTGIVSGLNMVHADYDNDGDPDVYVLRGAWLGGAGRHPNSLLRNDGGRFTDVAFAAGLGMFHYPTQTASWGDYDRDGDLDLYVGNESSHELDPEALVAAGYEAVVGIRAPSQLFRNEGHGTFTEVAEAAGVTNLRYAKGVGWGDYDEDGFPDLYVSNYGSPNRLYHNNGDGTFTDRAAEVGVDRPILGFPAWFWDYDNDGALDIFAASYSASANTVVAHYLRLPHEFETALLARGDGRGGFRDVTRDAGIEYPMLPMGANFGDLDNDGFLDFYLGTGSPSYVNLIPNVMFLNRWGERFVDVSMVGGFAHLQKGHGVAFADLDNDGDLDVFEQMGGAYPGDRFHDALYENPGFGHHWITVELEGVRSNRSAIGARIRLTLVEDGRERFVYRHVNTGGSFGASPLRQTIGLGAATSIRSLEILWPATGETQQLHDPPLDQVIRIVEGDPGYTTIALERFALGKGS